MIFQKKINWCAIIPSLDACYDALYNLFHRVAPAFSVCCGKQTLSAGAFFGNPQLFDKSKDTGLHFAASGNSSVGFGILNYESGRRFTFYSVPFFVPCFHQFCLRASQLVRLVRGASARWVCSCNQYSNSHQLRLFSFGIEIGDLKTGASL